MKTVYDSNEIPHLWAHQRVPSGRSPSALSFDGPVIKSYATWIGQILSNGVFLLNADSYSVTTSKHQCKVRQAIPQGATVFHVRDNQRGDQSYVAVWEPMSKAGRKIVSEYLERARELTAHAEEARQPKRDRLKAHAHHYLEEAKRAAEVFKVRVKIDEKTLDRLKAAKVRADKAAAKALAESQARKALEDARAIERWKAGEGTAWSHIDHPHTFLRVWSIDAETKPVVETSRGMRFRLSDARLALLFVLSKRTTGWHDNGESFAIADLSDRAWQIDAVNEFGVVAGCHRITWAEIDRVAPAILELEP